MKRRNKITFQGETVLIRVTLYTCTAVTFSTMWEKVLHPTTVSMPSTTKFWVHKVRSWSLLPRIFISPCIYATAVQKTNWLIIHPRVTVSWYIHCTLIHNIYDKEFLPRCSMLSYWQGAMNGLEDWVHQFPFTVVSHQKWPQYDSERYLIVSKKERWAYSYRVLHFHFCPPAV